MKLNITPGPWYIDGKHIVGDKTNFEYPNDTTSISDFSLDTEYIVPDADTQNRNAAAIITAVNNTYHKGINPEAVPDILEALKIAKNYIDVFLIRDEDPLVGENIKTHSYMIIEAIKKAKL